MKKINILVFITRMVIVVGLSACTSPAVPTSGVSSDYRFASRFTSTTQPMPGPTVPPAQRTGTNPAPIPVTSGATSTVPYTSLPPQYISPVQNAEYVSKDTTIAVRFGSRLGEQELSRVKFSVQGEASGLREGQTILAKDQKTVIFKPAQPFQPGELVKVSVAGLQVNETLGYLPVSYSFRVATDQQPGGVGASDQPAPPPKSAFPDFLTVPQDIPHFTVATTSTNPEEGYIFVAPIPWLQAITGAYLLILDGEGHLVYFQSMAGALNVYDFKVQPNGLLSYFDQNSSVYYVMNNHYQVVDTYRTGNGYTTDLHDLQLLPDGNALLMAYDAQKIDMSKRIPGGKPDATVTGLIIQELDAQKNVIFEWRSWDHFAFSDSTANLTDQEIDLVHGNSLDLTEDGNLLLSSRNQSEVTKINLETGAVMWRLGGKANQFKFVNGQPFAFQHDARQLPNGNITLFDNQGNAPGSQAPSRGLEYKIDEAQKTVTKVWEFQPSSPLPIFATFMGNAQRLDNGNTFINWGAPFKGEGYQFVSMTEVDPGNQVIFQLAFDQPYVSYRAFRSVWKGAPITRPVLAYQENGNELILGYSWNGATEVTSWKVFGGTPQKSLDEIEQKAKKDFETQSRLSNLPENECYFQVAALDQNGMEIARSPVISTNPTTCPPTE